MGISDTRIAFVTLGCAKNEVDTDKMRARLAAASFSFTSDEDAADIVIVNTCAFLEAAVEEAIEVILDIAERQEQREHPARILVAGCLPSRYGEQLQDELDEVACFVAVQDEDGIVDACLDLLGPDAAAHERPAGAPAALREEAGPSAYVKISDGCDTCCSYCMIPQIRGRYHSFAAEAIEREVAQLVEVGTREVVLIAQDTGIWGRDLPGAPTTASLLELLATRFADTWFRLMYVQPSGVTDELLSCMAAHDNVCSYLDIPLQHVSARLLSRMNRSGSAEEFLALVARIRAAVPGVTLRTTFMAGFPGETPEDVEELLAFIDDAEFDYAGVFPYSREEGSAAACFDGQVDEDEKIARAQRVLDACEAVGCARARLHIGREADVLVEGYECTDVGLEALCRSQAMAPDVDGQIHVPISHESELAIGTLTRVRIVDSFFHELEGERIV